LFRVFDHLHDNDVGGPKRVRNLHQYDCAHGKYIHRRLGVELAIGDKLRLDLL
jgi:hypothetical protein